MNGMSICLRDRSKRADPRMGLDMIVEVRRRAEEEELGESALFEEFVEKAKAKLPLDPEKVDVYIGLWESHPEFNVPKSFFDLISRQGWKVILELNK